MSDSIRLVIRCSVPAEKAGEAKRLLGILIETCQEKDLNLLSYEFFFSKAEDELYALELYKDSAAVLAHMGIAGATLTQLLETAPANRVEVFGNASAELKEAFGPLNALFVNHWNGFTR